jgi:hypothetical protein
MISSSTCFAPLPTSISTVSYERLLSRANFLIIASLSSLMPVLAVYLVLFWSMDSLAAIFIFSGVSKSGWPIPNLITLFPSFLSIWSISSAFF